MKVKILNTLFCLLLIFGFWWEDGWFVGGWFTLREEILTLNMYDENGAHQDMYGYNQFNYPGGHIEDSVDELD